MHVNPKRERISSVCVLNSRLFSIRFGMFYLFSVTMLTVLVFGLSVLFPAHSVQAQSRTANGIGDMLFDEVGMAAGMGGVQLGYLKERNFSIYNPAVSAYSDQSVYVIGVRVNDVHSTSPFWPSYHSRRSNPIRFQVVLKLPYKWCFNWALTPLSFVDYRGTRTAMYNQYTFKEIIHADGSLNVSAFSFSRPVGERFYFGFGVDYTFGTTDENWYREFTEFPILNTFSNIRKKYSGISFRLGGAALITDKLTAGAYFQTKASLTQRVYVTMDSLAQNYVKFKNETYNLPASAGFGFAYEIREGFDAGFDYLYKFWEDASVNNPKSDRYRNAWEIGAGIRYISSTFTRASYIKKIPLTFGIKYRKLPYESYPKNEEVIERLVSMGIELPITGRGGEFHFAVDFGRRGYITKNDWRENLIRIHMSFVGVIY